MRRRHLAALMAALMISLIAALVVILVPTINESERSVGPHNERNGLSNAGVGGQRSTDTDPGYLTQFGQHSHWLQPWRAYLETMPASVFVNGPGMNVSNLGPDPGLVMTMLGRHGIRHARIEEGWGHVNYADEGRLDNAGELAGYLLAAKAAGVRPLILLNANEGRPTPTMSADRLIQNGARAGDTSVQLDSTNGLIVGYSGFDRLSMNMAPEVFITAIHGDTVTLSKPLPTNLAAGASVAVSTLKYRPVSQPGSSDYQETIAGWRRYVRTVASFATATLGTLSQPDVGFDLEGWNELSFGSAFLDVNNYYVASPYTTNLGQARADMVRGIADEAAANPASFAGATIADGFANTIPWPAAAAEPPQVGAISKHPYSDRKHYPADEQSTTSVNALRQEDNSFIPTYSALFPEYAGTQIQTETMVRDMGPITNDVYAPPSHGRYAREIDGKVVPVTTWITEVNEAPSDDNPSISRKAALLLKAKTTARYLAFYLNKGVTQLDFFAADGGDRGLGMVQENFLALASKRGTTYPVDDASYTSPALAVIERMASIMSSSLDPSLTGGTTRPLIVGSVTDTHNHAQFLGDGSAAHPALYDRELLAILPFQVNVHKFVLPYYVMTRDVTKSLGNEQFTVKLQGINGATATVSVEDPMTGGSVSAGLVERESNALTLRLTATDYPYMLTVDNG